MSNDLRDLTRRPRWGTYSTKGHLDKASLTIDLLLYDKLIFPTPRPDAVDDWVKMGWHPEEQKKLLSLLGDELAYTAQWEGPLQDRFRTVHPEAVRELQVRGGGVAEEDLEKILKEIAFPQTAMLIAAAAADDPMFIANEPIPPIPIAAFQTEVEARAAYALRQVNSDVFEAEARSEIEQEFTALFARKLSIPDLEKIGVEDAFNRVVELVKKPNYKQARRALYDWEKAVVDERWSVDAATRKLAELSGEHDELVRQAFQRCWVDRAFSTAAVVLPPTAGLAGGPVGFLASMAISGLIVLAQSKAPKVKDPNAQPGAALAMAIDAVWKN